MGWMDRHAVGARLFQVEDPWRVLGLSNGELARHICHADLLTFLSGRGVGAAGCPLGVAPTPHLGEVWRGLRPLHTSPNCVEIIQDLCSSAATSARAGID